MGPGTETAWQHDGRMLPNGEVTFFDDGSNPPIHSQSRGVRIALDFKTRQARLAAAYTHPSPPLLAASQGNMQTLPTGTRSSATADCPRVSEFTANGSLLFDAHLPFDTSFYRAFRSPWNGHPLTPPAVSAKILSSGDSTAVYASWNGDTEVASWEGARRGKRGGRESRGIDAGERV